MPNPRYLDYRDQDIAAIGGMGSSYANTAIRLQQLRNAQMLRNYDQYVQNIRLGIDMQRLEMERPYHAARAEHEQLETKDLGERMGAANTASEMVGKLNAPVVPGGVGPPDPRAIQLQQLRQALARGAFENPAQAGEALRPRQYKPGPVFQDQLATQPSFVVPEGPAKPISPYQEATLKQKGESAAETKRYHDLQIQNKKQSKNPFRALLDQDMQSRTNILSAPVGGGAPTGRQGMFARNKATGKRIVSFDNGLTWRPAPDAE